MEEFFANLPAWGWIGLAVGWIVFAFLCAIATDPYLKD